jgi:secreted PhoX family phosphatase
MHTQEKLTRRSLVVRGSAGIAALALGPTLLSMSRPLLAKTLAQLGPLQVPDSNGIRLPPGFSSRMIAAAGAVVRKSDNANTGYLWHSYPDGGATFDAGDGGWIYVSNSETTSVLGGGASAIRFSADGKVLDAYRILSGSNNNCAGGATPWGTWLSCEEVEFGSVFECDPFGKNAAVVRPALGHFRHEAAAVDYQRGVVYLTEDQSDGCLYRFVSAGRKGDGRLDLDAGVLQAACAEASGLVRWAAVPHPTPNMMQTPTRRQLADSTHFDGGEGIWYGNGTLHFTTKGDNRVWALDTNRNRLSILYDARKIDNPVLTGVDNLTGTSNGDLLVAEDDGDMQIVVIDTQGNIAPLLQVAGQRQSEIAGPAFSPDGSRLYFSSQRGSLTVSDGSGFGLTYEISGPFQRFLRL